jgi:tRNA A-37 threonylcarbamoyl transferase component Bud32
MTTSSPDAHPTPPPAEGNPAAEPDAHSSQFPHADDDFGLTPKPKADEQAKTQRVDPLLGMDLGGVKIVRLLGEGGMGRVYEAQQHSPARTVAVKVIRAGITSEKTMRRFEREAEFLGKLQHPGIAQIYVVGSYSSDIGDVPFFVMEYIPNAKPITNYVSEQGLTVRDTLALFKHVCEAVSHGHDRGIVHRDLKPGNILIDSDGMPKVIDFGVARSTDSDLTLTAMRTDTGALVGTVQYMSPEQFGDSTAEGLDGRADVYALGVVLYELMAGELPYQVRRKKMHEAARIVCEYIPPTLRSRDRSIPRDVSLIAERCLQKNRRGRYQSAGELAGDIQRVLDGKSVRMPAMGWVSRVRERLWSRYGRLGLLGLVVAACLGFFLVGRAGRSGSDTKPSAGPAAKPTEPVRDVPPPPIAGSWAGDDGFGGKTLRIFREDGVFIERSAYGNARMGRWEALPDGVRVTLPDEPPVTGWFVNGALHLPSSGVPGVRRDPLVFERQPPPARPQ